MKALFLVVGLLFTPYPVFAQDNRPYSTCTKATDQLANRLAQDNIEAIETPENHIGSQSVKVILPQRKQLEKYSPTNRKYGYDVIFVGKRSVDLIASPVLLGHLAEAWFSACSDAATLTFGIYATSFMTTFGMNQGGVIKQWGCFEDIGYIPRRGRSFDTAPKWGYNFCSL